MGIGDSGMLAVGESVAETTGETIRRMADQDAELISIYYGVDVTEDEAETLNLPDADTAISPPTAVYLELLIILIAVVTVSSVTFLF